MAISTYDELKGAINRWLDRDDLSDSLDDFIDLAEAHFARTFRIRAMETALSVTIAGTTAALPSDYLSLKHAYIDGTPTQALDIVSAQQVYADYPNRTAAGRPAVIAEDGGEFIFGPSPDSLYTVAGVYYAALTPLDDTNTTNWLLANAPDLYLYRSLVEAEGFIGNDPRIALWATRAKAVEDGVKREDKMRKFSGDMSMASRLS